MINPKDGAGKSSNDYLEHLRQQIGAGYSDKPERTAKKELGKDDFIKLMSVQLKYQDPTSPLKNEEMAAQLAQFSGLEQMQNVNRNLEKMTGASEVRDNMMAASLIGKRVETDSSRFKLGEDHKATMNFELTQDMEKGKVAILDSKSNVVRELVLENMDKGKQTIKWDGHNDKGSYADQGDYTFRVTAYDKAGKQIEAKTNTNGIVSGVEFDKGKPVLLVGNEKVYMEVVSRIDNSSPEATAMPKGVAAGVGKPAVAGEKKPNLANPQALGMGALPAAAKQAGQAPGAAPSEMPESWPSQMSSGANGDSKLSKADVQETERPMVIDDVDPASAAQQAASNRNLTARPPTSAPLDSARLAGTNLWNPNSGGNE